MNTLKYFFYHLFTWRNFFAICLVFILQSILFTSYLTENHGTTLKEIIWNFYGIAHPGFELLKWLFHQIPLYALLGIFLQKQWNQLVYILPRIETSTKWWHNMAFTSFLFIGIYFFIGFHLTGITFLIVKWLFPLNNMVNSMLPFFTQNTSFIIHTFLLMWLHAFLLFLIYFMFYLFFRNLIVCTISVIAIIYCSSIALYLSSSLSAYLPTVRGMLLGHEKLNLSFVHSYLFFIILIIILYIGIHILLLQKKDILWKIKEEN